MKFLSVCSGIEAASVAWHDLGFECVGVSEIDKFPSEVLKHHYPSVPNLGDMNNYKEWKDDLAPDLLVGGTPCQSFSIAGMRKGMDDPRGNLALTYVRIAEKYKPQWFIWENVPGVLSSNGGKDFSSFVTAMADIGYGIAYRVLDAQFFGVPQRRRRVFVVGYLGDWRPAVSVLFESTSVFGHTAKGRKKGKGTAASTETSPRANGEGIISYALQGNMIGRKDTNGPQGTGINNELMFTITSVDKHAVATSQFWDGTQTAESLTTTSNDQRMPDKGRMQMVVEPNNPVYFGSDPNISDTVTSKWHKGSGGPSGNESGLFVGQPVKAIPYDLYQITAPINKQNREVGDPCHTLARDNTAHASIIEIKESNVYENHPQDSRVKQMGDISHTVSATWGMGGGNVPFVRDMRVRRLTPVECERLQGFPDNWTQIPYGKKSKEQCPEGHRYKALGNSMAVPVMKWIGRRIALFNSLKF